MTRLPYSQSLNLPATKDQRLLDSKSVVKKIHNFKTKPIFFPFGLKSNTLSFKIIFFKKSHTKFRCLDQDIFLSVMKLSSSIDHTIEVQLKPLPFYSESELLLWENGERALCNRTVPRFTTDSFVAIWSPWLSLWKKKRREFGTGPSVLRSMFVYSTEQKEERKSIATYNTMNYPRFHH